jgi:predicted nuclease of predicted toxin-antitoxin system
VISLLVDANISWRIIDRLVPFFERILHVNQTELAQPASDIEIWDYARKNDLTILTLDEDFEQLSIFKGFPPKVILLRGRNRSTAELVAILSSYLIEIDSFVENQNTGLLELSV